MSMTLLARRKIITAAVLGTMLLAVVLGARWLFVPAAPGPRETGAIVSADARALPAHVGFSIVKTGKMHVREALVFAGGALGTVLENDFSAFVVKHDDDLLLFDTGLGRNIDAQYEADMPRWMRLSFRYDRPISPARDQLDRAGRFPITRIFLSHAHWDHVAAIDDFPEAEVWTPQEELDVIRRSRTSSDGAWPSQVGSPSIRWRAYDFPGPPYEGFERSRDLYGDGRVVVVPLFGHTPGSVGLFVEVDSGRRFFFCGDAVWSAAAIPNAHPRSTVARWIADRDAPAAARVLEQLRSLRARHPDLTIVPAHDGAVQSALGFFPAWVR